jgi:hypothetical protein
MLRLDRTAGQGLDKVDSKQDSVDLTTAAGRLGLSVATLRKRLQRGTIAGFKATDGSWRVVLDKAEVDKPAVQDKPRRRPDKRQRTNPRRPAGSRLDNNRVDNSVSRGGQDISVLVEALRDEIQFLRAELQARDQQIDRFQVLLQQHQQQPPIRALPDHSPDWIQGWMRLWLWWLPR